MGQVFARREALVLVVTHALAFALPTIPLLHIARNLVHGAPFLNALQAEAYSGRIASFEEMVGDDHAAVAGLERHVERLTVIRHELVAAGAEPVDVDRSVCNALAQVAYLSEAANRDERIATASACFEKTCIRCKPLDAQQVLGLGARWVANARGSQ
jgi:hypothetical protein